MDKFGKAETADGIQIKMANDCCSSGENQNKLIDVLTDPHAAEKDWLSAFDELSKKSSPVQKTKRMKSSLVLIASLLLCVFVSMCVASSYHFGPPAQTQEVDFGPYMAALEKQIKSKWHPPTDQEAIVKMHFKVHPNGEISDVGFERMSRLSETDAAAIKAIVDAMPALPPLPSGFNDTMDISFTFEVNHKDRIKSN
jgi:hypothetical protein